MTRRAVEAAFAGDMLALKLCLERLLPRCQERPVEVAQGNLLRILTAGDDIEDENEDIGDAEAGDDCDR